jgi:hypothetical protein
MISLIESLRAEAQTLRSQNKSWRQARDMWLAEKHSLTRQLQAAVAATLGNDSDSVQPPPPPATRSGKHVGDDDDGSPPRSPSPALDARPVFTSAHGDDSNRPLTSTSSSTRSSTSTRSTTPATPPTPSHASPSLSSEDPPVLSSEELPPVMTQATLSEENSHTHPWISCHTDDGELYYFNTVSGESMWEKPPSRQTSD